MERSHAGIYTCQLNVLINNQQFKVSRAIRLHVEGGRDFSSYLVRSEGRLYRHEAALPPSGQTCAAHIQEFREKQNELHIFGFLA